ncbi:Cyclin/Brf1-like TBP-binding protein, putative isoform 2 [Hibiscus syriacus]|uniref:Cyclin/Brf1-like TBP-binding protein, putative isoform 2 n=1 Tax=Hibiscus syriacus TaxID=106335 RepID=A0A6A3D1Q7_HIBSY|nr:Cyclin/Brf1-like TBP-binding protein, putative isoform 2 [Hibiscus syriacus]
MVFCSSCSRNVAGERLNEGVLCCNFCGKVLEEYNYATEPQFVKDSAGQSKLSGNFVKSVQDISDSRRRTLDKAFDNMNSLRIQLEIDDYSDEVVQIARRFYEIGLERNFTRGRRSELVEAACLYLACRYELGSVYLQLCYVLYLADTKDLPKLVDPSIFIHKFTNTLIPEGNDAVVKTARDILASMKRDWMQTGRKPSGLCGAALYISALSHGLKVSKSKINYTSNHGLLQTSGSGGTGPRRRTIGRITDPVQTGLGRFGPLGPFLERAIAGEGVPRMLLEHETVERGRLTHTGDGETDEKVTTQRLGFEWTTMRSPTTPAVRQTDDDGSMKSQLTEGTITAVGAGWIDGGKLEDRGIEVVHICEATLSKRLIEFENTDAGALTVCIFQLVHGNLEELHCARKLMEEFTEKERELRNSSLTIKQPNTGSKETSLDEVLCRHTERKSFAYGLCNECYEEFMKVSGGLEGGSDPPAFQRAEKERLAKLSVEENSNFKHLIIRNLSVGTSCNPNSEDFGVVRQNFSYNSCNNDVSKGDDGRNLEKEEDNRENSEEGFRSKVETWLQTSLERRMSEEDGEHYLKKKSVTLPNNNGVSDKFEFDLNYCGDYAGIGLREAVDQKQDTDVVRDEAIVNNRAVPKKLRMVKDVNQVMLNAGSDSSFCEKKRNSVNFEDCEEIEPLNPNLMLSAPNQESLHSRGRTLIQHRRLLSSKSVPLERRRMASYRRFYSRSRVRNNWFENEHKGIHGRKDDVLQLTSENMGENVSVVPISVVGSGRSKRRERRVNQISTEDNIKMVASENRGIEQDVQVFGSANDQEKSLVPIFCKNISEDRSILPPVSKRGRKYRRERRVLTREAVDLVNVITVFSPQFSKLVEEALATWEVCQLLGISFKEEKETFIEKRLSLEHGSENDSTFELENQFISSRFIAITGRFRANNFICSLINVYGPSIEEEKRGFFEELGLFIGGLSDPICVGGDLNVYLHEDEKMGRAQNRNSIEIFSQFLLFTGLIDLPLNGGRFTWCNNQDSPTYVRLDRFLVDNRFLIAFPELAQYLLPRSISDHNAVLLENGGVNWGKKPFKLFNYLMDEVGFEDLVSSSIQDCKRNQRNAGIFSILKNTKIAIKNWVGRRDKFPGDLISDLELKIQKLEVDAHHGLLGSNSKTEHELRVLRSELWRLYKIEEQIWFQKSRSKWVEDGDRNTRYFHTCASIRRKRNALNALLVNGSFVHDPNVIKSTVREYFFKAFNDQFTLQVEDIGLDFSSITLEQSLRLEKEFSEEEI